MAESSGEGITVIDYLLHRTRATELCVLCDCGYIVETVWIDHEDLFMVTSKNRNRAVKETKWGTVTVRSWDGSKVIVPCRYIEMGEDLKR